MPLPQCYSCPLARWISVEGATEPRLECDPPMGECRAEFPQDEDDYVGPSDTAIERAERNACGLWDK